MNLWSLEVIILQYAYEYNRQKLKISDEKKSSAELIRTRQFDFVWCKNIVRQINDWDSNSLIDFLSTEMLKIESKKRLFTAECLRRVKNFELSIDFNFHRESTSTSRTFINDDDEDFIIIMRSLWNFEDVSSNTSNRELQYRIFESEFEERKKNINENSALQKRRRLSTEFSISKISNALQSKRLQRFDRHIVNTESDSSIQNETQSDDNYIFDAFWNSKNISSNDHNSKTSFINILSTAVSISALNFYQRSRNFYRERTKSVQIDCLTKAVLNSLRSDISVSMQKMCEIAQKWI